MKDLDFFYQTPLKNIKFIDRKCYITRSKTLIIGNVGSGKTSMICEYLSAYKQEERLYINLKDMRCNANLLSNLKDFLLANPNIKVLGVDNISSQDEANTLKICSSLPQLQGFLIATNNRDINLPNFNTLKLGYLDYEEFILFFRKNLDENMLFSHFLAHGTAVKCAFLDASEVSEYLQNQLKKELSQSALNIIKECARKCGETMSVFEIYKTLKTQQKISKDSVYTVLNELERDGIITLLAKFNEPNVAKKLFFTNFAMRNALSAKKDFSSTFANVILCELSKFNDEIYYTKEFDFFLVKRKLALLCIPFTPSEIIFLKFKKLHQSLKKLGATKLQVISVTNSGELSIEGIKCEILPFSRWALGI
ncbi:ATP-binding protein [Campylobacter sp. faydin G-24]|uniref:ATP-binding protein n=1 Tax=Campylobacter anatolicus TaxID=2829105 RepID=A0ABS5HKR4_9BACT|nr:ATP-binding protein [Campylobacter anatolicus]MBR8464167.1 ATP-binding protein [Campylobacter anatolicus]MBR8466073.1 ATP-binding protein [Campylobacter anatolicus]